MDIISEIDNRQKEITRLADECRRAQNAIVQMTERITYLRGQVDLLKQLGEVQAQDGEVQAKAQDNAGQTADAGQAQAG